MNYKIISPLGERVGIGTFDTFYDTDKYSSVEEALANNDAVRIDFVKGDDNIIYFEFFNIKNPEVKKYHRLEIQHFPVGVDVFDDRAACEIALTLF